MNKIAPQDMRQHLMLNQEIEDYWHATEEFSRDNKKQALWKEWQHEGQRKNCTKDSDFNLSVVNSESLVDTVIGVGESATKKPSVGLNKST